MSLKSVILKLRCCLMSMRSTAELMSANALRSGDYNDDQSAKHLSLRLRRSSQHRLGRPRRKWQPEKKYGQDLEYSKHAEDHKRHGNGGCVKDAKGAGPYAAGQTLCSPHASVCGPIANAAPEYQHMYMQTVK